MPRAVFVSDLHLFARRSQGDVWLPAMQQAARNADHFVLGGDIFDFRWSTITPAAVFDSAVSWLRDLTTVAPACQFHFLLGNHDDHAQLLQRLPALREEVPNFNWDRYYLRLGSSVFLHGDVADRKLTHDQFALRRDRIRHKTPAQWRHEAYHWILKTRVDQLVSRAAHPSRKVADRLLRYLQEIGHGPDQGVKDVYFGHTHRQLDAFQHGGLRFHNGGAPIGRSPFRILEADLQSETSHVFPSPPPAPDDPL